LEVGDTAGWEACATYALHILIEVNLKYPGWAMARLAFCGGSSGFH
jgi:hypothetical protein